MKPLYMLILATLALTKLDNSLPPYQIVTPNHPHLQYIGRFDFSDPKQAKFAWTGSSIALTFEGTFCKLLMRNFSEGKDKTGKPYANYFNIFIDGRLVKVLKAENHQSEYSIAENLPQGKHTVQIFKRTEALIGVCEFLGFQIDKKAKVLPAEKTASKKIEFIGDSITCGYGNEGDRQSCPFTPETENGQLAYAAITAQNLEAEYVTTCYSGKGLIQNYDKSKENTMPMLYQLVYPQRGQKWNFQQWIPDAVCINLGTNDFAHAIPDSTEFTKAYNLLIDSILINYPNASVFCLVGSMLNGKNLQVIKSYIEQVLSHQTAKGNKKVYFFEMSAQGKVGYGCDWHPNVAQHEINATELTVFMKEKMNW
ncbi:SGNH/GDSL hydrolase family protein [Thermoflexibacter ruber]|uniref:GDSL-like Lipase/Acylhydrolase family protein n=1 Tax=Thermoflexibacter ruber TaxID=1003 RepID=A0A1I2IMS4_9BACT|nr:SGNH/GDSL hydrolase family protein [Thermoflexibacter ruber]SFF41831.1 GDSL-like Lipase/Acylhydrolase family protein [Thermoflexibacter ruber]